MDETGLKSCIQKLTKRLQPLFEDVTEIEDRIQLVLDQPEVGAGLAQDLGVALGGPAAKTGLGRTTTSPRETARMATQHFKAAITSWRSRCIPRP